MKKDPKVNLNVGVSGAYGFKVFTPEGECRLELPLQGNLMLQRAEEEMAKQINSITTLFRWCYLGTGSSEPQPTDQGLQNRVGNAGDFGTNAQGTSNEIFPGVYKISFVRTATFNTAESNGIDGVQLAEVGSGFATSTGSSSIVSRSLIKDSQGNPTTIQLLPYEVLQVTFEASIYLDTRENFTGTFLLNEGLPDEEIFEYEMNYLRAGSANAVNGWGSTIFGGLRNLQLRNADELAPVTASSIGSTLQGSVSATLEPHIPGTNYRTTSYFVGINSGNSPEGITAFQFSEGTTSVFVQCVIRSQNDGGGIMKTNEHTLSLDNFFRITYTTAIPEE